MLFNIIKTIHIFSVISWMAGLLYLPRIFVYHANPKILKETSETFKIMERRLYNFIMIPAAIITWFTGLMMIHYIGLDLWLILKILLLFFLFALVKAIVPRYRYDQLMRLGWKIFLPLSLTYVVLTASYLFYFNLLPTI